MHSYTVLVQGKEYTVKRDKDGIFIMPEELEAWRGHNCALKPAWEPIILAMKPMPGTFAQNALDYGVSGLWIDGGRIPTEHTTERYSDGKNMYGGNSYNKSPTKQNTSRNGDIRGRWPANLILCHTEDCRLVGTRRVKGEKPRPKRFQTTDGGWKSQPYGNQEAKSYGDENGQEEIEAWECVPECPVRMLNEQSGKRPGDRPGRAPRHNRQSITSGQGIYGKFNDADTTGHTDTGGASRFFYTAKASKKEKTCGGTVENNHPTVKPLSVMRYLCKLTRTPTGGTVLDMFMGSGSTGRACILEDRDFIGIELERHSFDIARQCIKWQLEQTRQPCLPGDIWKGA